MNRNDLAALIEFGLHLRGRLNGTQANVAQDTLELSRLAKRLHYLDERYANGTIEANDEGTGEYDRKVRAALERAAVVLEPYGYYAYHQPDPAGASLYTEVRVPKSMNYWRDWAVPY